MFLRHYISKGQDPVVMPPRITTLYKLFRISKLTGTARLSVFININVNDFTIYVLLNGYQRINSSNIWTNCSSGSAQWPTDQAGSRVCTVQKWRKVAMICLWSKKTEACFWKTTILFYCILPLCESAQSVNTSVKLAVAANTKTLFCELI